MHIVIIYDCTIRTRPRGGGNVSRKGFKEIRIPPELSIHSQAKVR